MSLQTAYVLNLDRRTDRWIQCQRLWGDWFNLVRFTAIDTPQNGALGCKLSHNAVAEQYLRDEEFIAVLEDDAVPAAFEKIGLKCLDEARAHLKEWDVCFGGPLLDLTPIGMPKATLASTESPLFLQASYAHNTHFMLYNRNSLPFLGASLGSRLPIDMALGRSDARKWVPCRTLAIQSHADSDVGHPFIGLHELYLLSDKMLEDVIPTARNEWPSKSTMGDWSFKELK